MEKRPLQKLVESMEDVDLRCRSYSGRSMYGSECLGIVGDDLNHVVCNLIGHSLMGEHCLSDWEKEQLTSDLHRMRTDQMGKGVVVYFPGVPFVADDEDDTEVD